MANTTLNSEYIADRYVANNTSCFRPVALLCSAREVLQKGFPQLKRNDTWVVPYNIVPGTRVKRYIRALPTHKTGATAARCNKFLPPQTQKNFPREHPPQTKRIQSSLCMGGRSWGKFGVGQGGLEGRETPPKGVSLRLQGLPHLTPRKLQSTSGTRRGRNGGQDQDRVTLREPSHRSPICRRGDTCCCGEASSAPERRT